LGTGLGMGHGYGGRGLGIPSLADMKPPRFKPTKEQLAILIAAYNENKSVVQAEMCLDGADVRNPDPHARDRLVKQLGGGVKPKTLQIWFQNRSAGAHALQSRRADGQTV